MIPEIQRSKEVPNKILLAEVKNAIRAGQTVTLTVKGYSMRLFLENKRDKVKLESIAPEDVKVNDVVLAEIKPDVYVLHRVIKRDGHNLTLMGDGNIVGTETCQDLNVVGIATEFYRKGRQTPDSIKDRKWRIYSYIWLKLKPFRRIILGVYRRLPFQQDK